MRNQASFLCPNMRSDKTMKLKGNFHAEDFDYISIKVKACNKDERECASDAKLSKAVFDFI